MQEDAHSRKQKQMTRRVTFTPQLVRGSSRVRKVPVQKNTVIRESSNFPILQLEHTSCEAFMAYRLFTWAADHIWDRKWSKFFMMFPFSLIVLFLLIVIVACWFLWLVVYFVAIWMCIVPSIWSIVQIHTCFQRSIRNKIVSNILFVLCICGFPLIFFFFYLVCLGIVLSYKLFLKDMKSIFAGESSQLMRCKKINLTTSKIADLCEC